MSVYSVEPCHPMGFWGRRTHAELSDSGLDTIAATAWLESNARDLIERSVARAAYVAGGLLGREDVASVDFLLDDQFASAELMGLLPPERVAEMLSDGWARHGGRLSTEATVVSETSLGAAAADVLGDDHAVETVAGDFRGITITVPTHARGYTGDRVPSCPLLAAVWQMWRLGRLNGGREQVQWWGADPGRGSGRTFTMLNTSLIPVEAAVAAILDAVDSTSRSKAAYFFHPDHW